MNVDADEDEDEDNNVIKEAHNIIAWLKAHHFAAALGLHFT